MSNIVPKIKKSKLEIATPYIFLLMVLAVSTNYALDYNARQPEVQEEIVLCYKDAECVNWLNNNYRSETEWNKTLTALTKTFTRQANETSLLEADTKHNLDLIREQIVAIKDDIDEKFPVAQPVPTEGKTVPATTPFLTLTMDKLEWNQGSLIIFSGTASPTQTIMLTIKSPDRELISVAIPTSKILNGSWTAEYQSLFDDMLGTWQVYARQGDVTSKTIAFNIK